MDKALERLQNWDRRWNGLPRRAALLGGALLAAGVLVAVLPYVWPFAAALLCAMLLEPLLLRLERGVGRVHISRKLGAPIAILLLFGVAGAALTALLRRLVLQFIGLVRNVPQLVQWVDSVALPYLQRLYDDLNRLLPPGVSQGIAAALDALKQSLLRWAGSLSAAITGGAFSTALSLPNALLGVVLTVMGAYYFSAGRELIRGFFRRTLPVSWRRRYGFVRKNLLTALFGQVKSQLAVSLIVTAALTLAFVIYGVPYGLAAGVLIGVADALPVIGAGLFLIPWSLLSFIGGSTGTGVFMACAYVGVIVIRQIAEPRIVGRQLGLHPLLTMMAMYAGCRLTGFPGLLLGPALLQVMKAVLEADAAVQAVNPSENR